MKERKFEVLDFGTEIALLPIAENTELRGLLKFDKPVRGIMREIREEERGLEERKIRLLGVE